MRAFAQRFLRPGPGAEAEEPASVARVDPGDGAVGVFCDSPVLVCLSHAVDARSVSPRTVRVEDPRGALPGALALSPDRRVVVWRGERHFAPGLVHFVVVRGLCDARGAEVAPFTSRFIPCHVTAEDLGL